MSCVRAFRLSRLALLFAFAACGLDSDPAGLKRAATPPSAMSVGVDSAEACATGGYFTRLKVDPATTQAGDGWHFARITDAVTAARSGRLSRGEKTAATAACRIIIEVAPGTYTGSFAPSTTTEVLPLVFDAPRVTLEGGLRMALDAKGRATGAAVDEGQVSVIQPASPLTGTQAIIIVTDSSSGLQGDGVDDTHGDSVTVRGFEFRSGYAAPDSTAAGGGFAIFTTRVQGLVIEDNRFGFLLAAAVDGRASTARIEHNSAIDLGGACAICLAGPGSYDVTGNTVARSGIVGVLAVAGTLSPIPTGVRPVAISSAPAVNAVIDNNYIGGERRHPVGTAIRVSAIGQGVASMVGQQTTTSVTSNDLVDNRFGLIADGGFPPLNASTTIPSGHLTLTLGGNHFAQSCQANLLVALARHTRALGLPTPKANAGYLKHSMYSISLGGDLPWGDVWFSHPQSDSGVTLNNTLVVDGATIGTGDLTAYNDAECGFRPSTSAWIGLKNSDDVGTKFDLLTEIRRNGTVVASGQLNGVNGGSSGFNNAVQRSITTTLVATPALLPGDTLAVTISARIAEGVSGHTSGTARLWYGDASADSRISTLVGNGSHTFYLSTGDSLSTTPGTGPRRSVDKLVKKSGGNPFVPFGTWSKVF